MYKLGVVLPETETDLNTPEFSKDTYCLKKNLIIILKDLSQI